MTFDEPVAWMILKENKFKWEIITDNPNNYVFQEVIPLYTNQQVHPRVNDMKWFVRSKEKEHGDYWILAESRFSDMPRYTIYKSYARTFDTKEEAEKWLNPLTEAVQLPVEDE